MDLYRGFVVGLHPLNQGNLCRLIVDQLIHKHQHSVEFGLGASGAALAVVIPDGGLIRQIAGMGGVVLPSRMAA